MKNKLIPKHQNPSDRLVV